MRDLTLKERIVTELQSRGFEVSMARPRVDGADLWVRYRPATNPRLLRLRLKAVIARDGWLMHAPRAEDVSDDLYYIFADASETSIIYRIVPSTAVAQCVSAYHVAWLKRPGRHGQQHNDSQLRKFRDDDGRYVDAWPLICQ